MGNTIPRRVIIRIKWDNVSQTLSVASEIYGLNDDTLKQQNKTTKSSVTEVSATILWFLFMALNFFGKKTRGIVFFPGNTWVLPILQLIGVEKSPSSFCLHGVSEACRLGPVHVLE